MNTRLAMAWRNLWRNGRRTRITMSAVFANTAIMIVGLSLSQGIMDSTLNNVSNLVVGDAQIHAKAYRDERSLYQAVANPEKILAVAAQANISAAPRSFGAGLVSKGDKSSGALYRGIQPALEKVGFTLHERVAEGHFLSDIASQQVVIGRHVARSLEAKVGDELVAVVQAADGSMGNELYTVVGTLHAITEEIDRSAIVMHADDFETLFVAEGRVHEIAFNAHGNLSPERVRDIISAAAPLDETATWQELLPGLAQMVRSNSAGLVFFGLIFGSAAGLGVMNTMLMATHNRVREYGMMKALGASPWRVASDVATEALLLSALASAAGACAGSAVSLYLSQHGIPLGEAIAFGGVQISDAWTAAFSLKIVFLATGLAITMCLLAALYPAVKVARIQPVDAMNHV